SQRWQPRPEGTEPPDPRWADPSQFWRQERDRRPPRRPHPHRDAGGRRLWGPRHGRIRGCRRSPCWTSAGCSEARGWWLTGPNDPGPARFL
ncbi:hypothetical protein HK405_002200, partial [Cladochytrium tenue]